MADGRIPISSPSGPSKQQRRRAREWERRTEAFIEYAQGSTRLKSINDFVCAKRERVENENEWVPSKGQIVCDMRTIFGYDWPKRRKLIGNANRSEYSSLSIPNNVMNILKQSGRPTILSLNVETRVIRTLNEFEEKFETVIITPVLITSAASMEI